MVALPNFKTMRDILFNPKAALTRFAEKATAKQGIATAVGLLLLWAVITEILFLIGAFITGKNLVIFAGLTILALITLFIVSLVGLIINSYAAAYSAKKWFAGTGDKEKTMGLMGFAVVPFLFIGVIAAVIDLLLAMTANVFIYWAEIITLILFIVSSIWLLVLAFYAIQIANKTSMGKAIAAFVIGFIPAILIGSVIIFVGKAVIAATAVSFGIV